jgi:hypothetical protein
MAPICATRQDDLMLVVALTKIAQESKALRPRSLLKSSQRAMRGKSDDVLHAVRIFHAVNGA